MVNNIDPRHNNMQMVVYNPDNHNRHPNITPVFRSPLANNFHEEHQRYLEERNRVLRSIRQSAEVNEQNRNISRDAITTQMAGQLDDRPARGQTPTLRLYSNRNINSVTEDQQVYNVILDRNNSTRSNTQAQVTNEIEELDQNRASNLNNIESRSNDLPFDTNADVPRELRFIDAEAILENRNLNDIDRESNRLHNDTIRERLEELNEYTLNGNGWMDWIYNQFNFTGMNTLMILGGGLSFIAVGYLLTRNIHRYWINRNEVPTPNRTVTFNLNFLNRVINGRDNQNVSDSPPSIIERSISQFSRIRRSLRNFRSND